MRNIILSIDTSASPASVSLLNNNILIEQVFIDSPQETSSLLSKHTENLIYKHLGSASEIKNIAVSIGPGSFTGLRTGLSFVKGMVFALGCTITPINTLYGVYHAFKVKNDTTHYSHFTPMMNARKDKAFIAVFDHTGKQIRKNELIDLKEENSLAFLPKDTLLLPLHSKFSDFISKTHLDNQVVQLDSFQIGLASTKANSIADEKTIAYLEPDYLVNNYVKQVK